MLGANGIADFALAPAAGPAAIERENAPSSLFAAKTSLSACLLLASLPFPGVAHAQGRGDELSSAAAFVQARVVKLTGAAVGSQKGYGSGVIATPDGQIVTALTPLLEGASIRATLSDGRVLDATVAKRDEQRQLAVLKIEASGLPAFDLSAGTDALKTGQVGEWVLAAANPFKVAEGAEPVSVSLGIFAGRAPLEARYRRRDVAFRGEVILTDLVVSAPGMSGGALTDLRGRLLGVIGRPVKSEKTNTWLNYAIPSAEIADLLTDAATPPTQAAAPWARTPADADRLLIALGVRLFDVGGRTRPAYVERVRPDSPAAKAGLMVDDLLLNVEDVTVTTCEEVRSALTQLPHAARLKLVLKRGSRVESVEIDGSAQQPTTRAEGS